MHKEEAKRNLWWLGILEDSQIVISEVSKWRHKLTKSNLANWKVSGNSASEGRVRMNTSKVDQKFEEVKSKASRNVAKHFLMHLFVMPQPLSVLSQCLCHLPERNSKGNLLPLSWKVSSKRWRSQLYLCSWTSVQGYSNTQSWCIWLTSGFSSPFQLLWAMRISHSHRNPSWSCKPSSCQTRKFKKDVLGVNVNKKAAGTTDISCFVWSDVCHI